MSKTQAAPTEPVVLAAGVRLVGTLPLVGEPCPLDPEVHGALRVAASDKPFGYAAEATTLPLVVDEFARAGLDYPIVFYGSQRRPVAICAVSPRRNLFVGADGAYAPGAYIPGYLRRHPFFLAPEEDETRHVMCIDLASPLVGEGNRGEPLFADGAATPFLDRAVAFCRSYAEAEQRTAGFAALLDEYELLEPREAHFQERLPDGSTGEPRLLIEYAAVSVSALDALSPAIFADLRDRGVLDAIYAHLMSLGNWDRLAALDAQDPVKPA
jgi:hypothetical protein